MKKVKNKKRDEKPQRSIAKAISWRICATLTTIFLIFVFTRELTLALEIGVVEVMLKIIIYYFHERIWNRIEWGEVIVAEKETERDEI